MGEKVRWLAMASTILIMMDSLMQASTSATKLLYCTDVQQGYALKARLVLGIFLFLWTCFGLASLTSAYAFGVCVYFCGIFVCSIAEKFLVYYIDEQGLELWISFIFLIMQDISVYSAMAHFRDLRRLQKAKRIVEEFLAQHVAPPSACEQRTKLKNA